MERTNIERFERECATELEKRQQLLLEVQEASEIARC